MSRYYDWFESVTPEEYPEPRPSEAHEFDYPEEDAARWEEIKAEFIRKWLPYPRLTKRQAG